MPPKTGWLYATLISVLCQHWSAVVGSDHLSAFLITSLLILPPLLVIPTQKKVNNYLQNLAKINITEINFYHPSKSSVIIGRLHSGLSAWVMHIYVAEPWHR